MLCHYLIKFHLRQAIAFTCGAFQTGPIKSLDMPSAAADDSRALQAASRLSDALTPHPSMLAISS